MLQPKLTKVETISPLKLRLFYETGEVKLFDVAPYATGPWYGQLKLFQCGAAAARRRGYRMAGGTGRCAPRTV